MVNSAIFGLNNQEATKMRSKERKLEVFSARLTMDEQLLFECIADQRNLTKTGLLRHWIRTTGARLPKKVRKEVM